MVWGIYQCVEYRLLRLVSDEYMGRTIDIGGWFEDFSIRRWLYLMVAILEVILLGMDFLRFSILDRLGWWLTVEVGKTWGLAFGVGYLCRLFVSVVCYMFFVYIDGCVDMYSKIKISIMGFGYVFDVSIFFKLVVRLFLFRSLENLLMVYGN